MEKTNNNPADFLLDKPECTESKLTTVSVTQKLKEKLDTLKLVKRDTYNDVIQRLVDGTGSN